MKNFKCIMFTFLGTSLIIIIFGIYLYQNVMIRYASSRSGFDITLLKNLEQQQIHLVQSSLAQRIAYEISYLGKGDFHQENFKSICYGWDINSSKLILKHIEKTDISTSDELKKGFLMIKELCQK